MKYINEIDELTKHPKQVNALIKLINSISELISRVTLLVKSFFKKKENVKEPEKYESDGVAVPPKL